MNGFSGYFGPKWRFWGQNSGKGVAMFTPTNSFLLLGVVTSVLGYSWRKSIKKATVRVRTERTHTETEKN